MVTYKYDKARGAVVESKSLSKFKFSDAEREQQKKGNFRNSDNEGNIDPKDGIRQGSGVYAA